MELPHEYEDTANTNTDTSEDSTWVTKTEEPKHRLVPVTNKHRQAEVEMASEEECEQEGKRLIHIVSIENFQMCSRMLEKLGKSWSACKTSYTHR